MKNETEEIYCPRSMHTVFSSVVSRKCVNVEQILQSVFKTQSLMFDLLLKTLSDPAPRKLTAMQAGYLNRQTPKPNHASHYSSDALLARQTVMPLPHNFRSPKTDVERESNAHATRVPDHFLRIYRRAAQADWWSVRYIATYRVSHNNCQSQKNTY